MNIWMQELIALVREVKEDVEEIVLTERYPITVLLRGYELLEKLSSWEDVEYNLNRFGKGEQELFFDSLQQYCASYLEYGERLYAIMDAEQIRMKAAAYMGPWKRRHNEALEELEKAVALWEMAKKAHKAQEKGGFWERWKTLREVRKMAGFRLERKRTGNFVTRTFCLMEDARGKVRDAELKVYDHSVEYKCSPDLYAKLYEIIQSRYIKG